jgi:hypothetical protein
MTAALVRTLEANTYPSEKTRDTLVKIIGPLPLDFKQAQLE